MKVTMLIVLAGLLVLAVGCNKAAKPDSAIVVKHAVAEQAASAETPAASTEVPAAKAEAEEEHHGPTSVTLASGESVPVIEVCTLDEKPGANKGRLGIMGKVETVYADRGTFTLVDCAKMAGCKDDCCSKTQIPMSVPSDKFTGELPKAGEELIVVGNLTPLKTGFSFDVVEVRKGDQAIMTQKTEGQPAASA